MEKDRDVLTQGAQEQARRGARRVTGDSRLVGGASTRQMYKGGLETKGVLEQHWREADKTLPLALYDRLYCQLKSTAAFLLYCDVKYCVYRQIYFYINM